MTKGFICRAVLVSLLGGFAHAADDWSIDIVPSVSITQNAAISVSGSFYIVLTNLTDHNLTLCNDYYYGGDNNFSFICTTPDGKEITLRASAPLFITHSPDFFVVRPSGHYVFPIQWKGPKQGGWNTWTSDPDRKTLDLSPLLKPGLVTVVVVFSADHNEVVGKMIIDGVPITSWVGSVKSKPIKLMFLP